MCTGRAPEATARERLAPPHPDRPVPIGALRRCWERPTSPRAWYGFGAGCACAPLPPPPSGRYRTSDPSRKGVERRFSAAADVLGDRLAVGVSGIADPRPGRACSGSSFAFPHGIVGPERPLAGRGEGVNTHSPICRTKPSGRGVACLLDLGDVPAGAGRLFECDFSVRDVGPRGPSQHCGVPRSAPGHVDNRAPGTIKSDGLCPRRTLTYSFRSAGWPAPDGHES